MAGSTPVYGFPYPQPSDLVANYPALGEDLAEDVEAALPGVKGQLITYSTTPAKLSVGTNGHVLTADSAVAEGIKWAAPAPSGLTLITSVVFSTQSSVSINNCFSATYTYYRIIMDAATSSGDQRIFARMRLAGTDATTNYNDQRLVGYGSSSLAARATSQAQMEVFFAGTSRSICSLDLFYPATAIETGGTSLSSLKNASTSLEVQINSFSHTTSTAYDGITFFPAASNMSGLIRIYGYSN